MNFQDIRTQTNREELLELLRHGCRADGANDIAENLQFFRYSNLTEPRYGLYVPSVCHVAQGAKEVIFGEEVIRYDASNYLLISLDVPVSSRVIEATKDKPYLAFKLELEPSMIASVMLEAGLSPGRSDPSVKSMAVSSLQDDLLDPFVRLLRLASEPEDYRVVSPMVIREIIYRILKSDQGQRLRQMAAIGGHTHRITKAVQILRRKFKDPIAVEELAEELNMSVSSFHQHFKTATTMSPLQFQKTLRLQEARRLLLTENIDASAAAIIVGYDDASQFNREYKRQFGDPPKRDASKFKQAFAAVSP